MTYTPNTPQANDTIASTQPIIEGNFQYINTAMRQDHAWNGNEIASQADGTHQKISLPNQAADIVALGTGIAAVEYAIGGNLFAWNGAKLPVSGYSGSGTLTITTTPQLIVAVPADCIGFMMVSTNQAGIWSLYGFINIAGNGSAQQPVQQPSVTQLQAQVFTNQLLINRLTGVDYLAAYKYIYWPI